METLGIVTKNIRNIKSKENGDGVVEIWGFFFLCLHAESWCFGELRETLHSLSKMHNMTELIDLRLFCSLVTALSRAQPKIYRKEFFLHMLYKWVFG